MASIVSLYSEAVSANVPSDALPPEPPVLGTITAAQDTNTGAVPQGRTTITLNWTAPTLNERLPGEFLVVADGLAQSVETVYDPIAGAPGHELYEVTALTAGTTLSVAAARGDKVITVADATGIVADDWVQLEEGGQKEYAKVLSVNVNTLTLYHRLRIHASWTTSATVKEATVSLKVETTDYTINLSTGAIDLLNGQFTASNDVFIEYSVTLQDLDRYEIYRIPGSFPVSEPATYADVTGAGGVVTVDNNVGSGLVTYNDVLTASENGETWTYYLFAVDDEASANPSLADAVEVETFPTIPQNLGKSTSDQQIVLSWDAITDTNFDGINVYRDDGLTFEAATAIQANSSLVTGTSFDDSAGNVTNRVSSGVLPYPVNGSPYSYKIEAEDTVTLWSTGTQNQSQGQAAQLTASKTA